MTLFDRISTFIKNCPHGWASEEKGVSLAAAVLTMRPEICVEIGVWGGKSAIPIALALKEVGRGVLWAIDPWSPQASAAGQTEKNSQWWGEQDHELIYQYFLKNIEDTATQSCIRVIRQKSDDVQPPKQIGLFHCDGNHSDQAIRDVERFAPNVRTGGLVFMDDIQWEGGGVLRAVAKLKSFGFVSLYKMDTGELFQRVSQ